MAKAAESAQTGIVENIKHVPEQISGFYGDVRNEMRKVTTPTRKEVQATTIVVIITVFIFGVYFGVVDKIVGGSLNWVFDYFGRR
jgi:preprotein translocase subunit SecE